MSVPAIASPIVLVPGFLQAPEDLGALGAALRARGFGEERRDLLALTRDADAHEAARRLARSLPAGALLVGYSMGARLAIAAALHAEAKLAGLVLLSGSPGLADETARAERRALDEERARALTKDPAGFVDAWGELPLFGPLRRTPAFSALQARRRERLSPALARAWAHALEALGPGTMPPLWDSVSELGVPALFLAGELDPPYAVLAQRAAARAPRARFEILQNIGHALPLEAPTLVAERIAAFAAAPLPASPLSARPGKNPTHTMKEDRS